MTMPNRPVVHPSAVDRWLILIVSIGPLVAAGSGIHAWIDGDPGDAAMLFLIGGLAMLVTLAFINDLRRAIAGQAGKSDLPSSGRSWFSGRRNPKKGALVMSTP